MTEQPNTITLNADDYEERREARKRLRITHGSYFSLPGEEPRDWERERNDKFNALPVVYVDVELTPEQEEENKAHADGFKGLPIGIGPVPDLHARSRAYISKRDLRDFEAWLEDHRVEERVEKALAKRDKKPVYVHDSTPPFGYRRNLILTWVVIAMLSVAVALQGLVGLLT